jgi:hypothetical protein
MADPILPQFKNDHVTVNPCFGLVDWQFPMLRFAILSEHARRQFEVLGRRSWLGQKPHQHPSQKLLALQH